MKSEDIDTQLLTEYQNLLAVLVGTEKYFQTLNVDSGVRKSFKQLVRYLRSQPPDQIARILGEGSRKIEKGEEQRETELTDQDISTIPFEGILEIASDPKSSRKLLERIAILRFSMTKGGLSALRNRDALVEKLRTLIGNEGVHDSITRAAEQHAS